MCVFVCTNIYSQALYMESTWEQQILCRFWLLNTVLHGKELGLFGEIIGSRAKKVQNEP